MSMADTGLVSVPVRAIYLLLIPAMTNRLLIGLMRPLPCVGGTMVVTHFGIAPRVLGLAFCFVGSLVCAVLVGMGPAW